MRTWNGKNGDSKKSVYLNMQEAAPNRQTVTNRQSVSSSGNQIRRNSDLDMKNKLKGTKEINGYTVRPGFFRMNGTHAAENGVKVAVENLRRTNYIARIFQENRDLPVYYCWDSGHEICYTPGVNHLAIFSDKLICTHIHDNRGIFMKDDHMLPFDGVRDWKQTAALLRKSGYSGNICGELQRDAARYADIEDKDFIALAYERLKKFADMMED